MDKYTLIVDNPIFLFYLSTYVDNFFFFSPAPLLYHKKPPPCDKVRAFLHPFIINSFNISIIASAWKAQAVSSKKRTPSSRWYFNPLLSERAERNNYVKFPRYAFLTLTPDIFIILDSLSRASSSVSPA